MKKRLSCFAILAMAMANLQAADMEFLRQQSGFTQAVKVKYGTLIHTAQVFGRMPEETLEQLDASVKNSGANSAVVVKLNVYGANQQSIDAARAAIAKRYAMRMPATSYVVGKLAKSHAEIAMDAVAVADSAVQADKLRRVELNGQSSTLSVGSRAYVSGQAEKGTTTSEATRLTLESLHKTLEWLGTSMDNVVQVKCFLAPITDVEKVKKEFELVFGSGKVPPLVFVEWASALPIEIELIAACPVPTTGADPAKESNQTPLSASGTISPSIEYLTPPGMTASPIYCRVTKLNSPETIYVSSLYSTQVGSAEDEVMSVFEQLGKVLERSGSDFRHLAKATYYVSSAETSNKLNELRPNYYDPQRPPAASKAAVTSVGMPDRALTIDMIAVPARD